MEEFKNNKIEKREPTQEVVNEKLVDLYLNKKYKEELNKRIKMFNLRDPNKEATSFTMRKYGPSHSYLNIGKYDEYKEKYAEIEKENKQNVERAKEQTVITDGQKDGWKTELKESVEAVKTAFDEGVTESGWYGIHSFLYSEDSHIVPEEYDMKGLEAYTHDLEKKIRNLSDFQYGPEGKKVGLDKVAHCHGDHQGSYGGYFSVTEYECKENIDPDVRIGKILKLAGRFKKTPEQITTEKLEKTKQLELEKENKRKDKEEKAQVKVQKNLDKFDPQI